MKLTIVYGTAWDAASVVGAAEFIYKNIILYK